ncbi:FluG domain-containing protein [Cordyceps javanica]|uniref:FluG domain-containing protein n=1 Tax=Cordyceps javanica TaxID=43265 RepID=A0A545VHV6_9HYPO|nr:FluG domain-containing protein [Cordyceps javanica]TQW12475.1 FluG domain-containing protein [Cordyceps javanica]
MAIHRDIAEALRKAAKRRHRDTALRKEAQKNALLAEDYHTLQQQLNSTQFIQPLDAATTKSNIYYIKKRFIRFCQANKHAHWRTSLQPRYSDKGFIMTFLHWICETYLQKRRKKSKKKTVNQYWRDFKMLYRRCNKGQVVNPNHCEEIRKYINTELKEKFGLDDQPGAKPVLSVDDLLLGLTHHWSRDRSVFPTEDDRLDLPTIMLFQAYTACRPAELVDGTKCRAASDPMLDDCDREDAGGSERAADDKLARGCKQQPGNPSPPNRSIKQKQKSTTKSGYESEFDTDSDLDDPIFDGVDETDDGESDGDGDEDDTTDTKYSDVANEDVDMLPPEPNPHQPTATIEQDEDKYITRLHKALCYEDIVLWIVRDPNKGGRDVLAMEVFFRHHKGVDNKPKPTIFLFRENPLPILCPICHILARAIRDDAVDVGGFSHAAPFFSTKIGRAATKVNWKTSMLKTPIFRRSVRTTAGAWEKSTTDPMKYSAYAFYLDRIGSDLGSEDKWTSYCMRRGNVNALLKVAPNPVVDQVMRHDPMTGCLANAYLNRRVGFNTQDAYLERDPSADGLTKAFSHMSIRCNPEVPREIPKAELARLPPDPEVVELTREVKQTAIRLRQQYGFIKSAPADEKDKYQRRRCDLRNAEKAFKEDMTKIYQEAYRRRMHNEELERQLSGTAIEEKAEPSVEHQLPERTYLQPILCDFSTDMGFKEMTGRKIRAIDGMVRLAGCREVRRPQGVSPCDASRESSPEVAESKLLIKPEPFEDIPLLLGKTQCIYCVGDKRLTYAARTRRFNRVSHMMDHVENVHLRHEKGNAKFVCRHPGCQHLGDFLTSLDHFKNHVQTVHGVKLRA